MKALYKHDCKNSAKHHLGKYKHWAKVISSVDTDKTNGYAFGGEFLQVRAEHKLDVGALVVEICSDTIELYRIAEEGKVKITDAGTRSMSKLIEIAAAELDKIKTVKAPEEKLQEFLQRKEQLEKELDFVNEQIKTLAEVPSEDRTYQVIASRCHPLGD